MNIFVAGLSASGKSYLIENLSKRLKKQGYKYIHTSDLLRQLSQNKTESKLNIKKTKKNLGWYEFSNLDKVRKNDDSLDKKLDKYLLDLVKRKDKIIFDSWILPYLSKKGLKIWLHAGLEERAKRLSLRDKVSVMEAKKIIERKDKFAIDQFKKLYKYELGKDLNVFDCVIDTDKLNIAEVCDSAYDFIISKINVKNNAKGKQAIRKIKRKS